MKKSEIIDCIEENPIIAAIRDEGDLDEAISSQITTIFLIHGDIFNIKRMVDKIKSAGKNVLIHIDFLEGIGRDNKAVDYICEVIQPDGIISTKSSHIKYAMSKGMFAVQRVFLIDSQSYDLSVKTAQSIHPDMLEVLPGIMPEVLRRITKQVPMPVIAGGFIDSKEDIMNTLGAGAIAVSTGRNNLWVL